MIRRLVNAFAWGIVVGAVGKTAYDVDRDIRVMRARLAGLRVAALGVATTKQGGK